MGKILFHRLRETKECVCNEVKINGSTIDTEGFGKSFGQRSSEQNPRNLRY